jgi:hypothetical protein
VDRDQGRTLIAGVGYLETGNIKRAGSDVMVDVILMEKLTSRGAWL